METTDKCHAALAFMEWRFHRLGRQRPAGQDLPPPPVHTLMLRMVPPGLRCAAKLPVLHCGTQHCHMGDNEKCLWTSQLLVSSLCTWYGPFAPCVLCLAQDHAYKHSRLVISEYLRRDSGRSTEETTTTTIATATRDLRADHSRREHVGMVLVWQG